jgi:penicillin-binding protein 1C
MQYLHRGTPSPAPQPPAGLAQTRVNFDSQDAAATTEPSRIEWFIHGTEQSSFSRPPHTSSRAAARILHPVNGTLLAIDPDIPPKRQRLNLRASISNGRWVIDGKPVGQGQSLPWMPWPGRHRITLQTTSGQVLDSVEIEVRGAAVRPGVTAPGKRLQRQGNGR